MRRDKKLLLIALLAGAFAAGGLWWLQKWSVELVPVVVAAHDLPARHTLRHEDLSIIARPPSARDPKALHDLDSLIGKLLASPVYMGEQIRPDRVSLTERELGPDEVAMGFRTDLVASAGGLMNAGDVVDLYVSPGDANGQPAVGRRVEVWQIGSGYRVYSVRDGSARETGTTVNGADTSRSQGTAGIPVVVVLKVPSDHVSGLRQASLLGTLTFVKRNGITPPPEKPVLIPLPAAATQVDIRGVPLSSVPSGVPAPGTQPSPSKP